MSYLKTLFLVFTACFAVVSCMDTSNFTCIGNPYFSAAYLPNATSPGTTNETALAELNVTYNNVTGIYNFTNYTYLPACKKLKETGSCCDPRFINDSIQAYTSLFNASTDATVKIFNKRVGKLLSFGKSYGKILGTFVNLLASGHQMIFKILKNVNKIVGDQATLEKVMEVAENTNFTSFVTGLMSGNTNTSSVDTDPVHVMNATFQIFGVIADKAGIGKVEIANFFGALRTIQKTIATAPLKLMNDFKPFASVDPALISDSGDKWEPIIKELGNRTTNITLSLDMGGGKATKRFRFLAAGSESSVPIEFQQIIDSRNIEAISKAIKEAIVKAENSTDFFTILLKNSTDIYKKINETWTSDMKSLNDVQSIGNWAQTRDLIVRIAGFVFQDSLKKVVNVAENKKKCLNVVFQYQGYIGCLACDASAMALGKIKLDETNKTFSPVISSQYGKYIHGNCTDYAKDLLFMNNYLQSLKVMKAMSDTEDDVKKNASNVDDDFTKKIVVNNNSIAIDEQLYPNCSLDDVDCTWIQNKIIDNLGPTVALLCDFSSDDCDDFNKINDLRAPQVKKNGGQPANKRFLEETSSNGGVIYSNEASDEVSTTEVGYSTQPNYTVDSNSTQNATLNETSETPLDFSNNTNNSNNTKFGLKGMISIPLILVSIAAFFF